MVGVKNKHGNGYAVKAALTRTRSAMNHATGIVMYMVRDFEVKLEEEVLKMEASRIIPVSEYTKAKYPGKGKAKTPAPGNAVAGVKRGPGRPPKVMVHKARPPHPKAPKQWQPPPPGKVRCQCGGTHLPVNTPKGEQSWKSHSETKRHIAWMNKQMSYS